MSEQPRPLPSWRFHLVVAAICSVLFVLGWIWSTVQHISRSNGANVVVIVIICAVISPVAAHYWEKRQLDRFDAVLMIPWGLVLGMCIISIVEVSGRARFPLRDLDYGAIDTWLGVSVPGIRSWSLDHFAGRFCTACYPLLNWFLLAALLVPALCGRAVAAKTFVLANGIAFLISAPIFTLWPAIGPWYAFHTSASPAQLAIQREILGLHAGVASFDVAGVVSFPSFHVIWAILSAACLSTFRMLRIPAIILCALVIASTMTTGWHYFCDVLSGGIIAAAALVAARVVERRTRMAENAAIPAAECALQ
jgi:membrane-associated phospholipid phosphatase